jgi:hypothetical protein
MWDSADSVEEALAQAQLEETHVFDGKRLPGQNRDIAIDICAMTVDGGTLLYGVDEDDNNRITISAPIEIAGQRERIDQIVQTSIMEPPTIYISELPIETAPESGYLLVRVPQSPRAPHQVIVRNDMRFYGRGATGNRRLMEGEVAALYERRERWTVGRDAHLENVVQEALFADAPGWAYLHAFARPFGFDTGFLRKRITENEQQMRDALVAATGRDRVPDHVIYEPALEQQRGWELHGTEGIRIGSGETDRRHVIRVTIARDGEGRLFCCCGAPVRQNGPTSIFEHLVAGNLAGFFAVVGEFYDQAGYIGAVDVGVAVTGLRGSHSDFVIKQRRMQERVTFAEGIDQDQHRRTERVLATDLHDRPHEIAESLLRDLFDALVEMHFTPYR